MAKIAILLKSSANDDNIVWTNGTGASVAYGDPQVIEEAGSNLLGTALIPLNTAAATATTTAYVAGQFRVNKRAAVEFAAGQSVYYDVSETQADNAATATTDGDFVLGTACEAVTSAVSYVDVMLNEGPDAYTVVS